MNGRFLTGFFILAALSFIVNKSYACDKDPIAIITNCPKYVSVDQTASFNGSTSYDPDGGSIYEYHWDFPTEAYDISPDPPTAPIEYCKFSSVGEYKVKLQVKDDELQLSTWTECTVYVLEVDLDISGVPDDDEDDPGGYVPVNEDDDNNNLTPDKDPCEQQVDYEDNLVEILLSVNPDTFPGEVQLDIGGYGLIKIWSDPDKQNLIIPNGDPPLNYERWQPNQLPEKLYVEGIAPTFPDPPWGLVLRYYTPQDVSVYPPDPVSVTVIAVELFRRSSYDPVEDILDDWPKTETLLRSPKYIFGKKDPIYVRVRGLGSDPQETETYYDFVKVTSDSGGLQHLNMFETSPYSKVFNNSEEPNELLYLAHDNFEDGDGYKIKVINEPNLTFWMEIQPDSGDYRTCKKVMVDRAEVGVEWQSAYDTCSHLWEIESDRFGDKLYDNIGGDPCLVWYKNFNLSDLDSKASHWNTTEDSDYADSVDIASWSGHCNWLPGPKHAWHFFTSSDCVNLARADIDLGDEDADWLIFDTCYSLWGWKEDLKAELLTSGRCAHMFLGFDSFAHWDDTDCGKYFADRLKRVSIQQAWFEYCDNRQRDGCKVRVFRPPAYENESLAGEGPIEVKRDPTASDDWKIKAHVKQ